MSHSADDAVTNPSTTASFDAVLATRLSRRSLLKASFSASALAATGSLGLSACGGNLATANVRSVPQRVGRLDFAAVAKHTSDSLSVPPGYTARVIYALGDPLNASTPAFRNDGSDEAFEHRAGDHHDGMAWFGLNSNGDPDVNGAQRGLIAINHEATTDAKLTSFFQHPNGGTASLPRPAAESLKEINLHGLSVVEVDAAANGWAYVPTSLLNWRITPNTPMRLTGPAAGSDPLKSLRSPDGIQAFGTINNCGTGVTPWGTLLSGEENWAGYFFRDSADDARRSVQDVAALKRYGSTAGLGSRHGWETSGPDEVFARWNHSASAATALDDYRNEFHSFGYMVEVDAYSAKTRPAKRTAMGRFAHESAAFSTPVPGQPLAAYMGDDSRGEYIYKWVSAAPWNSADSAKNLPAGTDRIAIGDKYLNEGRLMVAQFNADGTGLWLELSLANPAIAQASNHTFSSAADVAIHSRLAADAVQATPMDRPEWSAVHPITGEIYISLTNNSNRKVQASGPGQWSVDAANPRAYTDDKNGRTQGPGNLNGHIIRLQENGGRADAVGFTWDVYAFGAQSDADSSQINLSGLTADNDFSSPDGLGFSPYTGIAWIQTDDGAYVDATNCMMLAAIPGQVGDGQRQTLSYPTAEGNTLQVTTPVGARPQAHQLKRFLVGPKDCEITGLCETPDGRALFINIQHPGENTRPADLVNPSLYTSQWPSNAGYGLGQRPRSATIVVTKDDGGVIGT